MRPSREQGSVVWRGVVCSVMVCDVAGLLDVHFHTSQWHDGMPVVTAKLTMSDCAEAFEPQMATQRRSHICK